MAELLASSGTGSHHREGAPRYQVETLVVKTEDVIRVTAPVNVEGLVIATQIRKDSTRKSATIILATHDMRSHTITAQKTEKT